MIEIEYSIGSTTTSMFVKNSHQFYLISEKWVKAAELTIGDILAARSGEFAEVLALNPLDPGFQCEELKLSHNHHYFLSTQGALAHDVACDKTPTDPLELIPYQLANRPSHFANGKPTGNHSGPWVAARYCNSETLSSKQSADCLTSNQQSTPQVIGWGCASDHCCAEDAAVGDLRKKLGSTIALHRGNVEISYAYIRKYTKKGRFVNKMSPCAYCRENYGSALNDSTIGNSNLVKNGRDYLPPKP